MKSKFILSEGTALGLGSILFIPGYFKVQQSPGTQNPLPKKLTRDPEVSVGHGREEKMYRNSIHETQQNETAHCRRNV